MAIDDAPHMTTARRLDGFQKLALATTATTYLLILVGGLVRASGAGMGCPDWPKCFGLWVPPTRAGELPPGFDPTQFNAALTWTEYANRLLGVTTGFLIFATLVAALVGHRREPGILWPSAAAFLGVGFQGWLGGRVVAHGLAPWIVTTHLVVALVIVSLLLYAAMNAFFAGGGGMAAPGRDRVAVWLAPGLVALTLLQVALGTQVRGAVDVAAALGVDRSRILRTMGGFDDAHRGVAVCVFAVAVWLWSRAHASSSPRAVQRAATAVVLLAAAQIGAGLLLAQLALPRAVQVAHLSIASLLLGAEMLLASLLRRLPATSSASEG
jgi:cytochrome c oxidase assembly protein subunit 15